MGGVQTLPIISGSGTIGTVDSLTLHFDNVREPEIPRSEMSLGVSRRLEEGNQSIEGRLAENDQLARGYQEVTDLEKRRFTDLPTRIEGDTARTVGIPGKLQGSEFVVESGGTIKMLEENIDRERLPGPADRSVRTTDDAGRCGARGLPIREIKEEISLLKEDRKWSKSVYISWGGQTRQIFFEETRAIEMITQKIKEIWGIPMKICWLSVKGKHESMITSWSETSTEEINK
jgi:hypothetical protein